jgi:ABC-type branched-subunit amino acid transport system substrate-binding protein/DNA-binding beta-propeller fold protein YncE/tRNA A-37 threonylcarbamoyl transferase component Bud32
VEGGLTVGSEFAGLRVDRLIAAGGMGEVYLAHDATLDRRVALKVVAPALAADPRYRERFLREARLAASLEHPAIVPVYAAGEIDGQLFLAMRFVEGGTLADRLAARGALPPAETVRLLAPVADALDAAHAAGLVHRDVKPGNVLLQGDTALLADFGLARSVASTDDLSQLEGAGITGTVGYVAPEQLEGETVAGPADQYALACILFECLTGKGPFDRPTDLAVVYAHLSDPPPSAAALRTELPRQVDGVLARGLAKSPEARYGSCRELVDALADACALAATARLRHRSTAGLVGAGLAIAVAVALVAVLATRGGDGTHHVTGPTTTTRLASEDTVALVDPVSLRVRDRLPVGRTPSAIAFGAGSAWVLDTDDQSISRIDTRTNTTTKFGIGLTPFDLTFGADALWVTAGEPSGTPFSGGEATRVARVDPANTSAIRWIDLPHPRAALLGPSGRGQIAFGLGAVWVVDPDGAITRIDAATREVTTIPDVGAFAIAVGDDQVWTLGGHGLREIDPETNRADAPISPQTATPTAIAVGGGAVWVADPERGLVVRVDPGPPVQTSTIATAPEASTIAFSDGRVWAADALGGTVVAIDAATNRAIQPPIAIGGAPQAVASSTGGVWVPTIGTRKPVPATTATPAKGDVAGCGPVYQAASGRPAILIATALPLHGPDAPYGLAMASAVRFALQEHGFRAGRYTIGYQSCDDAQNHTQESLENCYAIGKAIARTPRVLGVVGSWTSHCTEAELPFLNAAADGPVAMVSASATDPALTDPTLSEVNMRPSGTPSFVRVIATNGGQAAADASVLAQRLHVTRVFVLAEKEKYVGWYPGSVSGAFLRAAPGHGLQIAGLAGWKPGAGMRAYDEVAAKVAETPADGVLIAGYTEGGLIRALRQRLGPKFVVLASDGFTPISDVLTAAGSASLGMYVSSLEPTNDQLSDAGRQWARRYASTQPRNAVSGYAPLAAQAAEVLLAAIAQSDGTRASVSRALFLTNLPNGLIGPVRFTARGDPTSAPVTVVKIVGGNAPGPGFDPILQGADLYKTETGAQ